MSERRDTSENLLSPDAIERALSGRESKEKASAFRDRVDPATKHAIAALHDAPSSPPRALSPTPRVLEPTLEPPPSPDRAAEGPERPSQSRVIVLLLALLLVVALLVWWRWAPSPEGAATSSPTATQHVTTTPQQPQPETTSPGTSEQVPTTTRTSEPSAVPSGTPVPTHASVSTGTAPPHRPSATNVAPQTSSTSKLFFQDKP